MEILERLEAVLADVQCARKEIPSTGVEAVHAPRQERVNWIIAQLKSLEASIQALIADVEAGCSLAEMGFFGDELEVMLDDVSTQIAHLKGQLRAMKAIEQGG